MSTKDAVAVGDVFNYRGRRFSVLDIIGPRSLSLGESGKTAAPTHRFVAGDSLSCSWNETACEWVALNGTLHALREQAWYLISRTDVNLIEKGLEQIRTGPAPALEREIARATIHTLITGLHTTEAVPEDFRNE